MMLSAWPRLFCSNTPLDMPSQREKLQQDVRFRILRLLDTNPQMSQRALSRELGISLGAVNYCLNALLDKGLLKINNFRSSNKKLRYAYALTPKGVAEKTALTGRFLQRKLKEYDALKEEIESLQKDRELGAEMAPAPHAISGKRSRSNNSFHRDSDESRKQNSGPTVNDPKD